MKRKGPQSERRREMRAFRLIVLVTMGPALAAILLMRWSGHPGLHDALPFPAAPGATPITWRTLEELYAGNWLHGPHLDPGELMHVRLKAGATTPLLKNRSPSTANWSSNRRKWRPGTSSITWSSLPFAPEEIQGQKVNFSPN